MNKTHLQPLQLFRGYKSGERPSPDFIPDKYRSSEFAALAKAGMLRMNPAAEARQANKSVAQQMKHYGGPITTDNLVLAWAGVFAVAENEARQQIENSLREFTKALGPVEIHLFGNRPTEIGNIDGMFPTLFAPGILEDDNNTPMDVRRGILKSECGFDGLLYAGQTLASIRNGLAPFGNEIDAPFNWDYIMKRFIDNASSVGLSGETLKND